MTIDGADVLKAQTLEKKTRRHQAQKRIAHFARHVFQILAARQALQQIGQIFLQAHAQIGGELFTEKRRNRADPRDR